MSDTINIIGISGSLRRASFNTGLLRAAAELAPAGVTLRIHDLHDVPFYNGDDDHGAEGVPAGVVRLKAAIAAADALMIATPEYNYSVSGVLKNAIDWASRPGPGKDSPLRGKPLVMLGAGGMSGTMRAQFHLRQILVHSDVQVLNKPELYVARAWDRFDQGGNLTDEKIREQVRDLVAALAAWTRRLRD